MKIRKRKKKFWKPIVTGFITLYWMSMLLATYFLKAKYAEDFKQNAILQLSSIQQQAENELEYYDGAPKQYYAYLASQSTSTDNFGPFQQFSAAFYETDGTFLAKTEERLGSTIHTEQEGGIYRYYTLEQLSDEEKNQLAAYGQRYENLHASQEPPKYRVSMGISKDTQALCQIVVQEITWEPTAAKKTQEYTDPITDSSHFYENEQGTEYWETNSKIVWQRNYPDADDAPLKKNQMEMEDATLLFPYLARGGYSQWQRWSESSYLSDFERRLTFSQDDIERAIAKYSKNSYEIQTQDRLYACIWTGTEENLQPACYLELRFESHPWLAAMDYLKYVYVMGLALMIVCIAKSLYVTNQVYQQRAALEEMRRDFTNAMAHELKTPLSIIRGFAENLQEHHMENKRDYYLAQIIGQTEELDRLVTEMIAVSRMDSEELALPKESVSIYALIREQIERLQPMIAEKNIQVQYACNEDFVVAGDPGYLAKAIGNLVSNAVAYNIENGSIRIQTDARRCGIENTSPPLTEEQLAHAFDMFYSGDKSRNSKDKHMGLGLFLAKKILALHDLNISLENTQMGVQVWIEKQK